jgi:hypothetical protein
VSILSVKGLIRALKALKTVFEAIKNVFLGSFKLSEVSKVKIVDLKKNSLNPNYNNKCA